MRVRDHNDERDPKTGRYLAKTYAYHPYYVKPGFWNQWGPGALLFRAMGKDVPGMKGDLYQTNGYLHEEVGPKGMVGKGQEAMREWEEKLRAERPSGCPFALRT
jgi:hypothetical protein